MFSTSNLHEITRHDYFTFEMLPGCSNPHLLRDRRIIFGRYAVGEHQGLDTGRRCHPAAVLYGSMVSMMCFLSVAALGTLATRRSTAGTYSASCTRTSSHLGKLHEVSGPVRVARDDDAPVGGVEPVREGWRHRRVINESTSDLHILVAQDDAGLGQFVHVDAGGTKGTRPSSAMRVSMS